MLLRGLHLLANVLYSSPIQSEQGLHISATTIKTHLKKTCAWIFTGYFCCLCFLCPPYNLFLLVPTRCCPLAGTFTTLLQLLVLSVSSASQYPALHFVSAWGWGVSCRLISSQACNKGTLIKIIFCRLRHYACPFTSMISVNLRKAMR